MTKIVLSKDETSFLKGLPKIYYMPIIKQKVDDWVSSTNNINIGWIEVLNNLNEILRNAQNDVEQLLDERLATGKIKDKSQTRKSIVGNAFSNIIIGSSGFMGISTANSNQNPLGATVTALPCRQ